jgi:hypothetical protein
MASSVSRRVSAFQRGCPAEELVEDGSPLVTLESVVMMILRVTTGA